MADSAEKSEKSQSASLRRGRPAQGPSLSLGAGYGVADSLSKLQSTGGNRAVHTMLAGGFPLPPETREEFEQRFGADFADVRIHNDGRAHESAAALQAKAYTQGNNVAFSANRYAPHTSEGRRLLAHELAHVIQQRRGGADPRLNSNASHERGADAAARAFASGTGGVAVRGATAVGIARDKDESLIDRLKREAQALKERIPPELREKAQQLADHAADGVVDTVLVPVGGSMLADGLGSKLLHIAQGEPDASEALKGFVRDKALERVGAVKGVVSQVTEVVDTAMWYGNEYAELRDKAAAAIGGKPGSVGNRIVRDVIDTGVSVLPGGGGLPAAAQASSGAKALGWVDEQGGASITAPLSEKANKLGDWIEKKVGGTPSDPMLFTPMEKGELEGALATQVALAFTGAEEVKVATAALGLMGSFRGIVESIRADPNGFYKKPAFWSSILTAALSLVGLSKLKVGKKIVDIALKSGALLSVVPPLWQLYNDYTDPKLEAGDPKERHKVLVNDWNAVIRTAADALLAVAHSAIEGKRPAAGKPPTGEDEGNLGRTRQTGSPGDAGNAPPVPSDPIESGTGTRAKEKPATADQLRRATEQADKADAAARARRSSAADKQRRADDAAARARKVLTNSETKQNEAKVKSDVYEQKRAKADAMRDAPVEERDKAAARVARAKRSMENAQAKARRAQDRVPGADKKAQDAQRIADNARRRADAADSKAKAARTKAEGMKPKPDFETIFDPSDPAFASAPDATLKPNQEPIVWVRTGKGDVRNTYVPETDTRRFGKGDGFAMPKSIADEYGIRPAGTESQAAAIEPRRIGGRQVESLGAAGEKGRQFISATAKESNAVRVTSIRPDISEAHAYNELLNRGEYGILRPLGSNAPGVDAITAQIEFDAKGRPVRAKIFLDDVTTPTQQKGPKASHETWLGELDRAVNPPTPDAPPLDFGDPAIAAVIRKAAADGNVYVRIVRVDFTSTGQGAVRIDPAETWRVGTFRLPAALRRPLKPRGEHDETDVEKGSQ